MMTLFTKTLLSTLGEEKGGGNHSRHHKQIKINYFTALHTLPTQYLHYCNIPSQFDLLLNEFVKDQL